MSYTMETATPPAASASGNVYSALRPPAFWPDIPAAWFGHAENKFNLKGGDQESEKYDNLEDVLSSSSVRLVLNLLKNPYSNIPYSSFKGIVSRV
jgi:hypothetical protein